MVRRHRKVAKEINRFEIKPVDRSATILLEPIQLMERHVLFGHNGSVS